MHYKYAALAVVLLLVLGAAAQAGTISTLDQVNAAVNFAHRFDPDGDGTQVEIGQEFVPTLSGVDAVEMWLQTQDGLGGTFHIDLWSGAIGGTLLATSSADSIPSFPGSAAAYRLHFDFASTVALTPGQTYVMAPIVDSGDKFNLSIQFSV